MNESPQPNKKSRKRLTAPDLIGKKNRGEKITMLTAYDYTMASLLDASGVDVLLVVVKVAVGILAVVVVGGVVVVVGVVVGVIERFG